MVDRKREIYVKLENLSEIVRLMSEIKTKEEKLKLQFQEYDKLSSFENKVIDNWNNELEKLMQNLDHLTL